MIVTSRERECKYEPMFSKYPYNCASDAKAH